MASSLMQWLINPRRNRFAAQHYKALCNRLQKYGLMYDDLDIKEVLARLQREVVDARNQRLKRAMNLSMKHEYRPEDLQVKKENAEREALGALPLYQRTIP